MNLWNCKIACQRFKKSHKKPTGSTSDPFWFSASLCFKKSKNHDKKFQKCLKKFQKISEKFPKNFKKFWNFSENFNYQLNQKMWQLEKCSELYPAVPLSISGANSLCCFFKKLNKFFKKAMKKFLYFGKPQDFLFPIILQNSNYLQNR